MRIALLLSLILLISACVSITEAKSMCPPCINEAECKQPPSEHCRWGEVKDICDRRACAKGPGKRCGGPFSILGACGEGMWCHADERCHGCSIHTMKCFPESP